MSSFFKPRPDGIDLYVRLTPKAALDRIDGIETAADGRSHVKVRVRAIPENGAANQALERMMAKAVGVPVSAVSVVAGGTSRLKTLRVVGDAAELVERLQTLSK